MLNFVMERISGFRVFTLNWNNSQEDEEAEVENATLPAEHALPMVPWYSMFVFDTAFQV